MKKTEAAINLSILKTEEKAKTYIAFVKKKIISMRIPKNGFLRRKKIKLGWAELLYNIFQY